MGSLKLGLRSMRGQIKDFVFLSNLALNEMNKLHEAAGAPIDFDTMKLKGVMKPGRGKAALQLLDKILNPEARNKTKLLPQEKAAAALKVDAEEQRKIDALRPKDAFELALDRIEEWQRQGMYLAFIPAMAINLGLVGWYAQFNNLKVVDLTTMPLIGLFNTVAVVATTLVHNRFSMLPVLRAGFNQLGEEPFTQFVKETKKNLDETPSLPQLWLKRLMSGPKHD